MILIAIVLFLFGLFLNLFSTFIVSVPHLSTWDWSLLFAGLACWAIGGGVPVLRRRVSE